MDIRQRIKNQKPAVVEVDGGELGMVHMRPLTAGEAIEMFGEIQAAKLDGTWEKIALRYMIELLIKVVCDEKGKLELTEADIPMLLDLPFSITKPLTEKATEICGLSEKSQEAMASK